MSDYTQIEREAAAERQNLATSLDALAFSLAPENVKEHASTLAEQYGGDLGRQAWGAARQNPAAFALVGAGLSLMFTGTGSRPETTSSRRSTAMVPPTPALGGFDARVAAADADMKQEMTGMMDTNTDPRNAPRAAWLRAKLNDGLDALPDAARNRVLSARKAALDAQERVEEQARRAAQKSQTFLHDQPLAVGALALGMGALIGALLPATRREDHVLGERRDAVMAAAKSALREELDKLHQSARATLQGDDAASS